MGGLISLILAQEFPVSSVTTIASPLRLPNRTPYFTDVLKYAIRYKEWYDLPPLPGTAEEYMVHYSGTPLATGSSLIKLMQMAEAGLSHITAPCLVIQSKADETVDPASADLIHQGVASSLKRLIWLDISRHVSTLGPERDLIHQAITQFLKEAVSAKQADEVRL
jgi:carboxylesterase